MSMAQAQAEINRLNPFGIREGFNRDGAVFGPGEMKVLIPSESGKDSILLPRGIIRRMRGLNPFGIREGFNRFRVRGGHPAARS